MSLFIPRPRDLPTQIHGHVALQRAGEQEEATGGVLGRKEQPIAGPASLADSIIPALERHRAESTEVLWAREQAADMTTALLSLWSFTIPDYLTHPLTHSHQHYLHKVLISLPSREVTAAPGKKVCWFLCLSSNWRIQNMSLHEQGTWHCK